MNVWKALTEEFNIPVALQALGMMVAVVFIGILFWLFHYRYDAAFVTRLVGYDQGPAASIKKSKGAHWLISQEGAPIAEATMTSETSGNYDFVILESSNPRLYKGLKFSINRASILGQMTCVECALNPHGIGSVLPILWGLNNE